MRLKEPQDLRVLPNHPLTLVSEGKGPLGLPTSSSLVVQSVFRGSSILLFVKNMIAMVLSQRLPRLHSSWALQHIAYNDKLVREANTVVTKVLRTIACVHIRFEEVCELWEQFGNAEPPVDLLV